MGYIPLGNSMVYRIVDTKLHLTLKPRYSTRRAANLVADKLNLEYGAYRYYVGARIWSVDDYPASGDVAGEPEKGE